MTTITLTGGAVNNRVRCNHCRALFPAYVDRGDGAPLRWAEGTLGIYTLNADRTRTAPAVDPTLDRGTCVMATDETHGYTACPACGGSWDTSAGRNTDIVGIKGHMSTNACDSVCAFATSTVCKCQCGGMNHGTR
jgi:phage terminase large subunit GpA-like protein